MSTNLEVGIVGLPNVGKSTLFNAITKAGAEAANYPFCTIEPNVGIVEVPDPRIQVLTDMYNPKKTIPAVMRFVDIAGLVAGASKGEGLAISSSAISAKPTPSPKSSAALKIQTSPTSTAPSIPFVTSKRSIPSSAWPTWKQYRNGPTASPKLPSAAIKKPRPNTTS